LYAICTVLSPTVGCKSSVSRTRSS
jgi:hypothetical protein